MTDETQSQFTKPKRHYFFYAVVGFIVLALGSFVVYIQQEPPSEQDVIGSIQDQYASESTQSGEGFVVNDERITVVTSDDPYFGNPDASIQIVEFGDFQCPFCRQSVATVKALEDAFGDRIFFQYRDFPLVTIHEESLNAAVAAECAHDQGNDVFWAYHDRLFQFQEDIGPDIYVPLAERIGLDVGRFQRCFDSQLHIQEIQTDYDSGVFAGVSGTPTFFINGYKVTGVIPPETFVEIISKLLESQN